MRIDWRMAAGLPIVVGAALAAILGLSCAGGSGGSGTAQYEVTVWFNTTVTQDDIDEVDTLLRTFDGDMEFIIMESFPPIGRAVMAAEASGFCQTVETERAGQSYVLDVSCQPWAGSNGADPDTPVSTDNDAE